MIHLYSTRFYAKNNVLHRDVIHIYYLSNLIHAFYKNAIYKKQPVDTSVMSCISRYW